MTKLDKLLNEIEAKAGAAHKHICELAECPTRWSMTIPPRAEDSDLRLQAPLDAIPALVRMVRELREALGACNKHWFDASTKEGACGACDANLHETVMGRHGYSHIDDPCPFQAAHDAIAKVERIAEELK